MNIVLSVSVPCPLHKQIHKFKSEFLNSCTDLFLSRAALGSLLDLPRMPTEQIEGRTTPSVHQSMVWESSWLAWSPSSAGVWIVPSPAGSNQYV